MMTKLPARSLLLVVLALCGCSELDNCPDDSDEVVKITTGTTDPDSLMYWSAPWEGPLDYFPAKTTMRFHHDLETTPEDVSSYVSFEPSGSDLTENAGNQGRIYCVDNTEIWIKNDTCEEDFYVRVFARASGTSDTTCSCQDRFDKTCEP